MLGVFRGKWCRKSFRVPCTLITVFMLQTYIYCNTTLPRIARHNEIRVVMLEYNVERDKTSKVKQTIKNAYSSRSVILKWEFNTVHWSMHVSRLNIFQIYGSNYVIKTPFIHSNCHSWFGFSHNRIFEYFSYRRKFIPLCDNFVTHVSL